MGWLSWLLGGSSGRNSDLRGEAPRVSVTLSASVPERPRQFQGRTSFPEFAAIGQLGAVCASCKGDLPRKPRAKAKCPLCGEFNFVRSRPHDRQVVLLSKADCRLVEEQWATINGTIDEHRARWDREERHRATLRERFAAEPSDNDVRWSILQEDLELSIRSGRGPDRSTYFEMSEVCRKEKRWEDAASLLMAVCVLDLNHPAYHPPSDPIGRELWESRPAEMRLRIESALAGGVIARLRTALGCCSRTHQEAARTLFPRIAERLIAPTMPVQSDDAWRHIWREIANDTRG